MAEPSVEEGIRPSAMPLMVALEHVVLEPVLGTEVRIHGTQPAYRFHRGRNRKEQILGPGLDQ